MAEGIVKKMMAELGIRGIQPSFINTGGGCMAVSVHFGETLPGDALMFRYEILVTERDDNFGHDDYSGYDDDRMHGFFAGLYVFDDNGEPVRDECTTVYLTPDGLWSAEDLADNDNELPSGQSLLALTVEMLQCVDAIQFVVQKVEEAETGRAPGDGRTGDDDGCRLCVTCGVRPWGHGYCGEECSVCAAKS